ncbi:MAG: molybdopterin cofactor-binding domain-containing protein [Candidatus Bathyarchaeia archaeon]
MVEGRRIRRPVKENQYFTFMMWGFPEDEEYRIIGKPVPPKEAEKVTGKAVYTRDVKLPGMLYAKWLTSPYAHAKVKSVDVSKAKALPGVVDVLVCGDPDLASPTHPEGLGVGWNVKIPDWAFVLPSEAVYEGQPVAVAVCADTLETCDEALKLVKVEWEELPFILDRDEALKPDAPITQHFRQQKDNVVRELPMTRGETKFVKGNVEEGFKEADKIIEFEIKCGVNVPAGVEPFSSVAWLHEGYLDLWVSTQLPQGMFFAMQAAGVVGVPLNRLRVHQVCKGATFGGVTFTGNAAISSILAAIFSKRTGKPVKVLADWTNFSGITCEEEGRYKIKVGFKNDGTVTAVQILSNGTYGYAGLTIPGSKKLPKATAIKNIYCESVYPYVNKAPTVCYKHGTQETIPFIEIFNRVAAELGLDPTEVALKNDGCDGHPMHPDMDEIKREQGFPVRDSLKECIEAGKKVIGWDEKWHPPGAKRLPNGKYHGMGFAWTKEWRAAPEVPARFSAGVFFKQDGTVIIKGHRSVVGVSEPTTYCQIFAEESGIRYEDVDFDNQFAEATMMTPGGSGGLAWNSYIIKELGVKTRQKLLEVAAKHFGKTPQELHIEDSVIFEKANPQNKISVRELVWRYGREFQGGIWADGYAFIKGIENPPSPRKVYFWGRQAAFLEIEVDPETGKIDVENLVIVNDVGRVINPHSVSGQQYGGGFMGLGRAMTEEIVYDPLTGVKLNDDLAQYGVLAMGDIYPNHCIAVETRLGYGAYDNMGLGENPNCLVRGVLRAAVYNAIGKWINEDPITPDKILKALGKA